LILQIDSARLDRFGNAEDSLAILDSAPPSAPFLSDREARYLARSQQDGSNSEEIDEEELAIVDGNADGIALRGESGSDGARSSPFAGDGADWRAVLTLAPDGTRTACLERWAGITSVQVARRDELQQLFHAVSSLGRDMYSAVGPGLQSVGERTDWLHRILEGHMVESQQFRSTLGGSCDAFDTRLGVQHGNLERVAAQVSSLSHQFNLLSQHVQTVLEAVEGKLKEIPVIDSRLAELESVFSQRLENLTSHFSERLSILEKLPRHTVSESVAPSFVPTGVTSPPIAEGIAEDTFEFCFPAPIPVLGHSRASTVVPVVEMVGTVSVAPVSALPTSWRDTWQPRPSAEAGGGGEGGLPSATGGSSSAGGGPMGFSDFQSGPPGGGPAGTTPHSTTHPWGYAPWLGDLEKGRPKFGGEAKQWAEFLLGFKQWVILVGAPAAQHGRILFQSVPQPLQASLLQSAERHRFEFDSLVSFLEKRYSFPTADWNRSRFAACHLETPVSLDSYQIWFLEWMELSEKAGITEPELRVVFLREVGRSWATFVLKRGLDASVKKMGAQMLAKLQQASVVDEILSSTDGGPDIFGAASVSVVDTNRRGRTPSRFDRPAPLSATDGPACFSCGKPGHYKRDCRVRPASSDRRSGSPAPIKSGSTCWLCGQTGHFSRDCPRAAGSKGGGRGAGKGKGGSKGGGAKGGGGGYGNGGGRGKSPSRPVFSSHK
jgi:uncharacterized membrane protein YgcG